MAITLTDFSIRQSLFSVKSLDCKINGQALGADAHLGKMFEKWAKIFKNWAKKIYSFGAAFWHIHTGAFMLLCSLLLFPL